MADAGFTPDPGGPAAQQSPPAGTSPPRRRPRRDGKRDQLAKVEDRLNEMFATIAIAQSGLGVMSGDQRHVVGGHVTSELSPQLVAAWIKLARENPRVEKVLLRMSETTAWGEVILASAGFAYSQAQAYGAVPPTMPNPWVHIPVPPSADVAAATADPPPPDWSPPAANGADPITGRQPPRSGLDADDPAHNEAERQRRLAEQKRAEMFRRQGS